MTQQLIDDVLVDWGGNPTIRQAVGLYGKLGRTARARDFAERTRVEYDRDLRGLLSFLESRGTIMVAQVSRLHLVAYQAEMRRRGLSPTARHRATHAIKSFCSFLVAERQTQENLAAQLIPPHVPYRVPRYLSAAEHARLLAACRDHPRDLAIIQLVLEAGITLSELARLTVDDIQIAERLNPAFADVGIAYVTGRRGAERSIALNRTACRALRGWLTTRPVSDHRALWLSKFGTPLTHKAIHNAVTGHMKAAGITRASVRSLRHSMATHLLAGGTDLETVQETLGHVRIRTTALYIPLAKQEQRRALVERAL